METPQPRRVPSYDRPLVSQITVLRVKSSVLRVKPIVLRVKPIVSRVKPTI